MGVAISFIVIGMLVLVIGVLACLASLQNAIQFIGAVLVCVLGAVLLTGGAIIEAIVGLRPKSAAKP